MEQSESLVSVDQHVLQFKDAKTKVDGIWTNDPFDDKERGLGIAKGSIWMTHFSRGGGSVPILTEVHSTTPANDDLDDYDGVIEGTLALPSGLMSIENESGSVATVKVPPGVYRVRVHYGNKDTGRYDYADGAEHARLVLFASPEKPVDTFDVVLDKSASPAATLDRARRRGLGSCQTRGAWFATVCTHPTHVFQGGSCKGEEGWRQYPWASGLIAVSVGSQVRKRLSGGGRRIRTIGPASENAFRDCPV